MMWWWMLGCLQPTPQSGAVPECAPGRVVLSTTDFGVGALAVFDEDGLVDTLVPTAGDPMVQAVGCEVLQADRAGGDSLRRYRGTDWTAPAWEVALPAQTNVHGMTQVDQTVWVAGWGQTSLLGFDAHTGELQQEIDLSAYADEDGIPELEDVLFAAGLLWVSAQRFDRSSWQSAQGRVLGIDPTSGEVEVEVTTGPSPFLYAFAEHVHLLVQTGTYFQADGGLHWLSPSTGALSPLWEEPSEDIVGVAGNAEGLVVLSSSLDGTTYRVWCMDPSTGERALGHETGAFLTDVVVDHSGRVTVAARRNVDGSGQPGLLELDQSTCTLRSDEPTQSLLEPWNLTLSEPGAQR